MKNFTKLKAVRMMSGIIALAVIGFTMLACASVPPGAEESTLVPDASNAVVYFLQPTIMGGGGEIAIWDGETPVGKIKGGLYRNVAYKVRPGTHYFMANRFNWSHVKVDARANNTYYIKLNWAPNPIPFANVFVILDLMTQNDGLEQFKKNEKTIAFTEDWRKEYKNSLSPEDLAEVRKNLADARK